MSDNPNDPLIGRTVSHYQIVAKIGGGGMGVVYRARDTRLGRDVALKFLPPQWSHDDGARERFIREAQAASATNHRNICIVHDIGQADDGQLFIVMAYYEGQTLKRKLEAGALPVGEAIEIAAEIAEGLAKAHAQRVVHRDVKPGNVMVTDDGVKILDFGLAKFADALQLTIPGSTVGTVAYMAPEQARGEEAGASSDVWALGAVIYEMLTGGVPFKGAYPEATFYAIKHEPLPPILTPTGEAVPLALAAVVQRALEKDPEKRFPSAREPARELRLLLGRTMPLDLRTEEISRPFGDRTLEPVPWWRRLRLTSRAVIATAAMILAAAAGGVWFWSTRPVVRVSVGVAPMANRTGEPALDGDRLALTESLVRELLDSPNIRVIPFLRLAEIVRPFAQGGADVSSREAVQAIAGTGVSFVVMPALVSRDGKWLVRAEVRDVATGTNVGAYETEAVASSLPRDTAYALMASVADQIQAHFRARGPGRSYRMSPPGARFRGIEAAQAFTQGLDAYEQQEYAAAYEAFRRAAEADAQQALAHLWAGRAALLLVDNNEAAAAAQRAKQAVTSDTPAADAIRIDALLAEAQRDFRAAEERYRRVTAMRPDDLTPIFEVADFLRRQNRNVEAVEAYHQVTRVDERYVRPRVDLCQLYTRLDEFSLAEQQANAAIELYRTAGNRAGEAQALLCLGEAERARGGERLADARTYVETARDAFESLGQRYALSRAANYLGLIAGAERKFPEAVRFFQDALSRSREIGNRQIEGLALMNLGVAYESMGQRGLVLEYYQQSRDFYQQIGDERRAAEQEANAASLLVNFGSDQAAALRRLAAARATFQRLGNVDFEIFAMQVEAGSYLLTGRHVEGQRLLRQALSLANERQLRDNVVSLSVRLAQSHLAMNQYGQALEQLEQVIGSEAGRDSLDARIALGRTYTRLGDFDTARQHLDAALTGMEGRGELSVAPSLHTAFGELADASGATPEARAAFEKAAALWTDELPDDASIQARCRQAALDTGGALRPDTRRVITAAIEQARKMEHLSTEVLCRVHLARLDFGARRYSDALTALTAVPDEGDRTVGPELRALSYYWRSLALAGNGDPTAAESERARAQALLQQLLQSVPERFRDRFAQRSDIRDVLQSDAVRIAR